jgi:hypothetical protein
MVMLEKFESEKEIKKAVRISATHALKYSIATGLVCTALIHVPSIRSVAEKHRNTALGTAVSLVVIASEISRRRKMNAMLRK